MPHMRQSVPIDHFRCYLTDCKDPRFNEYMTLPASWTSAEAHAAVDAVNNCDKRPFRSAWSYEAEIDQLKRQLDAIAKERNTARHGAEALNEALNIRNRELAQARAEAEKAHADAEGWKNHVDFERAKYIELSNSVCRAELLAKKHEQLDPQYGAAAERAKREQLESELRLVQTNCKNLEQAAGVWQGLFEKEVAAVKRLGEYIQALPFVPGTAGEHYCDIALRYLKNQRSTIEGLQAQLPSKAIQEDNERLKKMVDDWRVKARKVTAYENAVNCMLRETHVSPTVTPDNVMGYAERAAVMIRELRNQAAARVSGAPTPEQDRKVGAAMRELGALSSPKYAMAILCLLTALLDARNGK